MTRNRLASTLGRFASAFRMRTRQEIELDYLNRSVSLHDLERRQREIEAGKFRSF